MIAEDGAQLGVMTPPDALRLAREQGLDLVEVAPQTTPPVCRIMDFNKFKYEQTKQEREAKKKRHVVKLKEMKFKPHIDQHDYQVKLQQLQRFLTRGDQVKVTLVFRGREMAHVQLGRRVLERLVTDLKAVGRVERNPSLEGRFMTMIFSPDHAALKARARKQHAQDPRARAVSLSGTGAQPPAPTTQPAPLPVQKVEGQAGRRDAAEGTSPETSSTSSTASP